MAAGGSKPSVIGESSLDQNGLSGYFRDGRGPGIASQGMQVGLLDTVGGFGQDVG